MNAPEDTRVNGALDAARKEIQGCFDHFGVGASLSAMNPDSSRQANNYGMQLTSHWAHYERIFKQAAEKDRSRTAQLGKVIASVSHHPNFSLTSTLNHP